MSGDALVTLQVAVSERLIIVKGDPSYSVTN
jgi:hypothetical protein